MMGPLTIHLSPGRWFSNFSFAMTKTDWSWLKMVAFLMPPSWSDSFGWMKKEHGPFLSSRAPMRFFLVTGSNGSAMTQYSLVLRMVSFTSWL